MTSELDQTLQKQIQAVKEGFDVLKDAANDFNRHAAFLKSAMEKVSYELGNRRKIEIQNGVTYKDGELRAMDSQFELSIKLKANEARKLAYSILQQLEA